MDFTFLLDFEKLFQIILVLVISVIYLKLKNSERIPGGPWGFPIIGNRGILRKRPHIQLTQLRVTFGDVFSIMLGSWGRQRVVVVCSWEGFQAGLNRKTLQTSGRPKKVMKNMFNDDTYCRGITHSDLSVHFNIKKEFTLFSLDSLCCCSMVEEIITGEAEKLALFLLAQRRSCDLSIIFELTSLRLMLYLVNGKLYQATDENFIEIWKTFRTNSDILDNRWRNFIEFQPWKINSMNNLFEIRQRKELHYAYQRDIVNRHKDCFNPDIISDIIDHGLVMLEKGEDMGELNQDELDGLFVELSSSGYRQISAVLLWLVLYVGYFPEVQNKIYAELMSVVGQERLPRLSDRPQLVYTSAVILETHRLASVMPLLYPHRTSENIPFMGYHIPKDTIMLFNVWCLHHDSKHWMHPMKFLPERFLKDGELCIPDHFLPFGDGLRACPGERLADKQLFIFTTIFFYYLQFQLEGKPDLEGELKGFVLSPKPYKVSMTARDTVDLSCFDDETEEPDISEADTTLLVTDD